MINNRDWIGLTILPNVLDRSAWLQYNRRRLSVNMTEMKVFLKGRVSQSHMTQKNRCTKLYNKRNLGEIE